MTIDPSTSRFWQDAQRCGLAVEADLRACWDAIPAEKRTGDAVDRRLARQAVQAEVLTLWQAQQVLAGRGAALNLGKYRLLDVIGQGGMGRVYLGWDTRLKRKVAIKILSRERMSSPRALARFEREAKVGAQLQHDNLVRIYDEGEERGLRYLVMEYIEGRNVGQVIAERGRLPAATAASIARQVCIGLEHARQKGLIHRDINPQNILVTRDGTAKLADLGLAIDLHDPDDVVTRDGATVGTFDYISPEQARHPRSVDTRSDLYSLGCTLYHMLAGRVPFATASLPEKLYAHQLNHAEPLANLVPGVPPGLAQIVDRLMAKAPGDRYGGPIEVAEALEPYALNAGSISAVLDSPLAPAEPEGPSEAEAASGDRPGPASDYVVQRPEVRPPGELPPTRTASSLKPASPANGVGPATPPPRSPSPAPPQPPTSADSDPEAPPRAAPIVPATEPEPVDTGFGLPIDLGPEPSLVESLVESRSRSRGAGSRSSSNSGSQETEARAAAPPAVTAAAPAPEPVARRRRLLRLGAIAGAVVAAAGLVALAVVLLRPGPAAEAETDDGAGTTGRGDAAIADAGGGAAVVEAADGAIPAFAVARSGGGPAVPCDDFAAALARAGGLGGDVLIGPSAPPLRVGGKQRAYLVPRHRITLRPHPGTRGVLTVYIEGNDPLLLQKDGDLTLADLTVRVRYEGDVPADRERPPLIEANGRLTLDHCTFEVVTSRGTGTRTVRSTGLGTTVDGCLFLGFDRPIDVVAYPGRDHEVRDSIFAWPSGAADRRPGWALRAVAPENRHSGDEPGSLNLERCSVLRAAGLIELPEPDADVPLSVTLTDSAIRADSLLLWPGDEPPFPGASPLPRRALLGRRQQPLRPPGLLLGRLQRRRPARPRRRPDGLRLLGRRPRRRRRRRVRAGDRRAPRRVLAGHRHPRPRRLRDRDDPRRRHRRRPRRRRPPGPLRRRGPLFVPAARGRGRDSGRAGRPGSSGRRRGRRTPGARASARPPGMIDVSPTRRSSIDAFGTRTIAASASARTSSAAVSSRTTPAITRPSSVATRTG